MHKHYSSNLNIKKEVIKVSNLPALQKLELQRKAIVEREKPLDNRHNQLHKELFKVNCFALFNKQLINLLLSDDWCEPITKVRAIEWVDKEGMTFKYYDEFPRTEIKAPPLTQSDATGFRYSKVFVTHDDKYIWVVDSLPEAFKLAEKVKEYNTTLWTIEELIEKKIKLQDKIKKIKEQATGGKLTQIPDRKRKAVA